MQRAFFLTVTAIGEAGTGALLLSLPAAALSLLLRIAATFLVHNNSLWEEL